MRNKGRKATFISVAAAAVLVVVLLAAGTLLRMQTDGTGFAQAFAAFVSDTFRAGR